MKILDNSVASKPTTHEDAVQVQISDTLHPDAAKVLLAVGNQRFSSRSMLEGLTDLHRQRINYFLDLLKAKAFITEKTANDIRITKEGRDYLVRHDLI